MIRKCDGSDPNLSMYRDPEGRPTVRRVDGETVIPCSCGRTFDDVNQSTIYPHHRIHSHVCKLCGLAVLIPGTGEWVQPDMPDFPPIPECQHESW
jgi:hypothetical protein